MFAYDPPLAGSRKPQYLASNTSGAPVTAHASAGSSILHSIDHTYIRLEVDPWNNMKLACLSGLRGKRMLLLLMVLWWNLAHPVCASELQARASRLASWTGCLVIDLPSNSHTRTFWCSLEPVERGQ